MASEVEGNGSLLRPSWPPGDIQVLGPGQPVAEGLRRSRTGGGMRVSMGLMGFLLGTERGLFRRVRGRGGGQGGEGVGL
jgi:hypothetical protein